MFEKIKNVLRCIVELGLLLLAVGVVLQILFGAAVPFIKLNIVESITTLLDSLGNAGLVGLMSLFVIVWLFQKAEKSQSK